MEDEVAPAADVAGSDTLSAHREEAAMLGREDEQQENMILLYYCYLPIGETEDHAQFHRDTCRSLLNGRIRVSPEGINGVLSGRGHDLREYESKLRHELTSLVAPPIDGSSSSNIALDLDMKYCHLRKDIPAHQQLFDSLSVKVTREVVSLVETPQPKSKGGRSRCRQRRRQRRKEKETELNGRDSEHTCLEDWKSEKAATHLSPSEWNETLLRASEASEGGLNEDDILIDVRNVYESNVGHFAVPNLQTLMPNTRKHSSMADAFDSETTAKALSGRRVFMYCTGGVRCERAGSYLKALSESNAGAWKGVEPPSAVYQLKGGIQNYLQQFGDQAEEARTKQDKDVDKLCLFRGKSLRFCVSLLQTALPPLLH